MIIHVTKDTVDKVWPLMEGGLFRALTKTSLGELWDLPSALKGVKSEELYGFYCTESGYSGLYSINQLPLGRVLYFFWSGKQKGNANPINFQEVNEYLQVVADAFNCKQISCEGRVGWREILKPLGYKLDSHTYTKERSYEHSKI